MSDRLAAVHPEPIPEWPAQNDPLTPDRITGGINKRYVNGANIPITDYYCKMCE